ncbi:MAG: MBL fold metallo-hydrolase [Deltaproteobacteria bacterium]|nr:MAG: MBL fold metallo-hydrolase [Deltaproteobacteria bacterium]
MKLTFYGATDTVTGSKFLVETERTRILVDCGLFQGVKSLRSRNWDRFPVKTDSLDAVVLTHAHLDHSGYVPVLTRRGRFRGKILCTTGTRDLARILLPDSGHLQEEQAKFLNRIGATRHRPAEPLYTSDEALAALKYFEAVPRHEDVQVGDLTIRFSRAGHILGASSVHVSDGRRSISFSGDVGRASDPLLKPPERMQDADVVVVESTYGNRRHPEVDTAQELAEVVRDTNARGGVLLIPAFAVGRSQMVLHELAKGMAAGTIPRVPVYLDSPMAISATELFVANDEDSRLSDAERQAMCDLVQPTPTVEQSKAITHAKGPMIVLSASGMATGGRILHHLAARLEDPANTVLFVGFQAAGTRGEALTSGAEEIKLHGRYFQVRAQIRRIEALSAHADYREILEWLRPMRKPESCYVVHGEPSARDAMRVRLQDELDWNAFAPPHGFSTLL